MRDDNFEWNDAKAAANQAKHGISFEQARAAFDDPFGIEFIDEDSLGEDRFLLVASSEGPLLAIVYTDRDTRHRIISARRATKNEQDEYYRQNAEGI